MNSFSKRSSGRSTSTELVVLALLSLCRLEASAAQPFINVLSEHRWTLGRVEFRLAETERLSTIWLRQMIVPGRQVVLSAGITGRGYRSIELPCSLMLLGGVLGSAGVIVVVCLAMAWRKKSTAGLLKVWGVGV